MLIIPSKKIETTNPDIKTEPKHSPQEILDKYATTILRTNKIHTNKEGKSVPDSHQPEMYQTENFRNDIVLWHPPKDCIRVEFEHPDPEKNRRYITELVSACKSIWIHYCVTFHKGSKSPYLNIFNLKGIPMGADNLLAKHAFLDPLFTEEMWQYFDSTNLSWTLSPVIGHRHWKKKYQGAIHEIVEGIHPLDQINEYPKYLLKDIAKAKQYSKTQIIKTKLNAKWVEDFLLNYCVENIKKISGGIRHRVIEKNIAALIVDRPDRDDIIRRYTENKKPDPANIETWINDIIKGTRWAVNPGELINIIRNHKIAYEIPADQTQIPEESEITEPVLNDGELKLLTKHQEKVKIGGHDDTKSENSDNPVNQFLRRNKLKLMISLVDFCIRKY